MISLQKIITYLKSRIDKNSSDITALNNGLSNKCLTAYYNDTAATDVAWLIANKARYAVNNGLTAGKSIIFGGGWQGKQYGTTIVTHLGPAFIVVFFGNVDIYIGMCDTNYVTSSVRHFSGS